MKATSILLADQLPTARTLGKTTFRISRSYQPPRSAAAAYAAHIHKNIHPAEHPSNLEANMVYT